MSVTDPVIALLLDNLDRSYDANSWHGPNLRGSIRRVNAETAAWRPGPQRHSIAEQVLHAAYWKYAARRRLAGDERGTFPLKGSNWFEVDEALTESEWKRHVALLGSEHKRLREVVASCGPGRLDVELPGGSGKTTVRALILGITAHDIYHAGQIQLLKRLNAEVRD